MVGPVEARDQDMA